MNEIQEYLKSFRGESLIEERVELLTMLIENVREEGRDEADYLSYTQRKWL